MDKFHTQQEEPVDITALQLDILHSAEFEVWPAAGGWSKVVLLHKISSYRLSSKYTINPNIQYRRNYSHTDEYDLVLGNNIFFNSIII